MDNQEDRASPSDRAFVNGAEQVVPAVPASIPDAESLVSLVAREGEIRTAIKLHEEKAAAERKRLSDAHTALRHKIGCAKGGLDLGRIEAALGILQLRGSYANGGQDRASVIRDAIDWFATGKSAAYRGLDQEHYGTKRYDGWHGQRCDCARGMGPRHGSIIFSIGLTDQSRELTETERDACIYFLLNIEGWESAKPALEATS